MSAADTETRTPRVLLCRDIPTSLLDEAEDAGKVVVLRRGTREEARRPAPRQWIADRIQDVDAVIVTLTEPIDAGMIQAAPRLKSISSMSVGTDHIDVACAKERGIQLGTTPAVLDDAVAELTVLLILGALRNVAEATHVVRSGEWKAHPWAPGAFCGPSLSGKTIAFLGFGSIAQSTAALLSAFRPAKIIYATSSPRSFALDSPYFGRLKERSFPADKVLIENEPNLHRLAAQADVLIVLTTLTPATKHLIDADLLRCMKKSAVVINTSRGGVIDTQALVQAVEEERLAGAGLDVLEGEPDVPASHPILHNKCAQRVLVLPHIGSATYEARRDMANLTARHVLDHLGIK